MAQHHFTREEIERIYKEHQCNGARILWIGSGCLNNIVWDGEKFIVSEEINLNDISARKCCYITSFVIYKHERPLSHPSHTSVQLMPDLDLRDYLTHLGSFHTLTDLLRDDLKVCVYERRLRIQAAGSRVGALVKAANARKARQSRKPVDRSA